MSVCWEWLRIPDYQNIHISTNVSMLINHSYTSCSYHDHYEVIHGAAAQWLSFQDQITHHPLAALNSTGQSFAHLAAHEAFSNGVGAIDGCHIGIKVTNTPDAQTNFSFSAFPVFACFDPPGYVTFGMVATPASTHPSTHLFQASVASGRMWLSTFTEVLYSSTNLRYLCFTQVFSFHDTLYFYSTTFQMEILYILPNYNYLTALVTLQMKIFAHKVGDALGFLLTKM